MAQGSFSAGLGQLGNVLFPTDPSLDPEQAAQLRRAAIVQLGLGTLAGAQQSGATFGGSLFGGFQQAQQALAAGQQQAQQTRSQRAREDREGRIEKQEGERIKIAQADVARKERERGASVAQRFSRGLEQYKADPLGYYNIVSRDPEFQATAKQYGLDPASITTADQVLQLGNELGALGAVGAETPREPREPREPLEVVVGADGVPRYQPSSKAIGQQAYRGKGLAVTLPDGTTISDGGPGVVQPGELTKPTQNKLQESIIGAQDRLDRLNSTLATYKPEFLQARGLIKGKAGELVEFLGGELDPETKKYLSEYSEFKATAANDFNQTLRELSGAAVTPSEFERAQKAAPSADDRSPTQFEAKAKATAKTIKRAILRANYALKNGIGTKSVDELSKLIPLEAVDAIYEARANQILEELGGGDDKRAEAIQRANQEFGIAR